MNFEIARWVWIPAFAGMTDRQSSFCQMLFIFLELCEIKYLL